MKSQIDYSRSRGDTSPAVAFPMLGGATQLFRLVGFFRIAMRFALGSAFPLQHRRPASADFF
jgi:hypothetical protein